MLSPARREAAAAGPVARRSVNAHVLGGDAVVLSGKGLRIPRQLSFERWPTVGAKLSEIHSSYKGRYKDAVEQTSLDYQTLRNYAWVARGFRCPVDGTA